MGPVLLMITLLLARSGLVQAPQSLLSNGDFETAKKSSDWPDHWPRPEGATWQLEAGNHFLRLSPTRPDRFVTVYRAVDVNPAHLAYVLSFRVRATGIKRGQENWHDGRIILDFKDAQNRKLAPGPKPPVFTGTTQGWQERRVAFLVPRGAVKLEVMPALFKIAAGTLDLDDLNLSPLTDEAEIEKLRKAVRPATLPATELRGSRPVPAELRVVGNRLQADGKAVWLQGVNIPSLEWSNAGENVLRSIVVATEDWQANVIRLPVREDRWFGRDKAQKDGGAAYRKLIDDAVVAASTRGAYLILDLHRYRAPTEAHAAFWREAAGHFKNHPAVLFDLFNEPHDITWQVWRDGGPVQHTRKADTGPGEVTETFTSVGMQRLVDVVREAGARNVIVAGGLGYAYDLSGVLKGFALRDPGGNGIMYSTHVYHWHAGWRDRFLEVAAQHPVLLGETGCQVAKLPFVPAEKQEDPATWAPDLMGLVQKHRLNWTAWSFHPGASPRLLAGWDYTPTPYWGEPVRSALRGQRFEMKRER